MSSEMMTVKPCKSSKIWDFFIIFSSVYKTSKGNIEKKIISLGFGAQIFWKVGDLIHKK